MTMNNEELVEQISKERMLQKNTKRLYWASISKYSEFHNMSMHELLKEAETEEETGVRWKNRQIRQRLIDFRTYCNNSMIKSSAKQYTNIIQSVYRHFEIEVHQLPSYSERNLNENPPVTFEDIPTRETLQKALDYGNNLMRAIVLFMSSSGCARKETLTLTIEQLIEATRDYHTGGDDIIAILMELREQKDVIPTFKLRRHKTNRHYYTFCSPEATYQICNYLLSSERPLSLTDSVFKISEYVFSKHFNRLNDKLNLGMRGTRHKLTSHMLRKYHATVLNNIGILTDTEVHFLQGRARNQLDEVYLLKDPQILKDKYSLCLKELQVNWKERTLTRETPEYTAVVEENKELKETLCKQDDRLNKLESLMEKYNARSLRNIV